MKLISKGFSWFQNILSRKIEETGAQYTAYGIFGIFNFPIYYLIWLYLAPQTYESLFLRLVCTGLCLVLALHDKWPNSCKKYLPFYWYFTLAFTLPFFFTFMLMMNHGSSAWVTNTIVIVFFVLLLVDWISAIFILAIGSILGILAASFFVDLSFPASFDYLGFFITYFVAIVIGTIFAHNKQVIEKIKRHSIKAEANSKAKSEFIANMSHDLRTPITGILGIAQDLINTAETAEDKINEIDNLKEQKTTFTKIVNRVHEDGSLLMGATNELLSLCNEILEIIQIESGKASQAHKQSFSLDRLIKHNIAMLKPVASHKQLELTYEIDSDVPPFLRGMSTYLDRVVLNLISNALKFTSKGSIKVHASVEKKPENDGQTILLSIAVKDTGIGIPKDKFDVIFENFSRLNPAYEGNYQGAGLGLFSVKQYINEMNGIIDVESELNQGTCFTVKIPFEISDHDDKSYAEQQPAGLPKTTRTINKELAILVVEDNALAARAVVTQLQSFMCNIDIAKNGTEALDKVLANRYQLIFMDIGLPDISGVEVTKKIRALDNTEKNQIPIVALTGHAQNGEMRQECLNAGMQDVISKPAHKALLEEILNSYLDYSLTDNELPTQEITSGDADTIINWPATVASLGDEPFARELLDMLVNDVIYFANCLAPLYEKEDINTLRDELHKVRGGVCYLVLPELESKLKSFHEAIKSTGKPFEKNERTETAFQQLNIAIKNFLNEYEKYKLNS